MATLEKIRNKAGILVSAVIGLALLAFILGDFMGNKNGRSSRKDNVVGEIGGKKIEIQQFEAMVNDLTSIYKLRSGNAAPDDKAIDGLRDEAWQQLVNDYVMGTEYSKLGLVVSSEELSEYMIGANIHPMLKQAFSDPQTGGFNKNMVLQFMKYTNDNPTSPQMQFRLYIEDIIKNDRLNTKYVNLLRKGLAVPTFLAKADYQENNNKVDFNFIVQRYTDISDKDITVTPEALKKYYKSHEYLYEQSATRDIEYVTFDIKPSKLDKAAAEEWINKIKPDFTTTTEVEQFVNENSDTQYNDMSYKQNEMPDSLGKVLFNAPAGEVYGPYFNGSSYKLARVYKDVMSPDSVKARHILFMTKGKSPEEAAKAKALADSVMKVLSNKKSDFSVLALKYSDDKGSAMKGGDLGWFKEGQMVKPFNDAAFETKKGDTKLVESEYGYHIIQVEDRGKEVKKVKLAIIERKLSPSQATFNQVYAAAMKFSSENQTYSKFLSAIEKQKLTKKLASNLTETEKNIPGIDQPKQILRWAFESKKGEVSEPKQVQDQFIVAALADVRPKGVAPLEQVKSDVENQVRKELRIAKLNEKINKVKTGATTIQDLAAKLNTTVETANQISFSSYSIPNYGIEPKIVAFASVYPKNKISQPVDGNNGLYVVYINNVENSDTKDYSDVKQKLTMSIQQRANYESYNTLKKLAEISDNRVKFY